MNNNIDLASHNHSLFDSYGIFELYEIIGINQLNNLDSGIIEQSFAPNPNNSEESISVGSDSGNEFSLKGELDENNRFIANNNYNEVNQLVINQQPHLPNTLSNQNEELNKHKRKRSSGNCTNKKRQKRRGRIDSNFDDADEDIEEKVEITEEDIQKYKKLENTKRKCCYCKSNITILEVFKIGKRYSCKKCAEDEKINLTRLKTDLFEDFDFTREKLYNCKRLKHARPVSHFIKYRKSNNSYKLVKLCCYCRLYKSVENKLKNSSNSYVDV